MEDKIEKVLADLLDINKPKVFWGKDGQEVTFIKAFEKQCVSLSQQIPRNPKKLTVLEFYQAIETLVKQAKEQEKRNKKRRNG